jgi:hypothetical protein
MMKMSIKGLDQLEKRLNQLASRAKALEGTRSVALTDMLTPEFVGAHTKYSDLAAFFDSGGLEMTSHTDLETISSERLDAHVRSSSSFKSWSEMLGAAGREYARRKMGF